MIMRIGMKEINGRSSLGSGGSRISPRRGRQLPGGGGRQHTILLNFPKNCMKLKEFGPQLGGASVAPPLDPQLLGSCCDDILSLSIKFRFCDRQK